MTTTSSPVAGTVRPRVDPRGPRFGAVITSLVLVVVLLTIPTMFAGALLAAQTVVFALGAFIGLSSHPYGIVFRKVVRPRLAPPGELEDAAPPRFAQGVGFGFAIVGLIGLVAGVAPLAYLAIGLALAAAFLNAAFNFCLGCEMYLLGARLYGDRTTTGTTVN
jgi:hypothetical protein